MPFRAVSMRPYAARRSFALLRNDNSPGSAGLVGSTAFSTTAADDGVSAAGFFKVSAAGFFKMGLGNPLDDEDTNFFKMDLGFFKMDLGSPLEDEAMAFFGAICVGLYKGQPDTPLCLGRVCEERLRTTK